MKNYFYGISKTANIRSNYYSENRNILSSDNIKLARYAGVGAISRQSGVDQKILNFGAMDPRLSGAQRTQVIEDRMRQINEVTKNNPNFKMSPEAYKAIFEGEAFQAKIQLNAPDRRNLAITGALTLIQLGAAIATGGNSGFNSKQAEIMTGRAQADAEFVTKYGNNYNRGFLGIGAQFQDGNIEITTGAPRREQLEAQIETKNVDAATVAKGFQNPSASRLTSVEKALVERVLSQPNHQSTDISKEGTIEDDSYKRLGASYLKKAGVSDETIKAITNGTRLDPSQIDQLRKIGFSIGQDNGGGKGVVTSIVASEANLTGTGVKAKLATDATRDFLKLAVTAGLITEGEAGDISKLKGKALFELLKKAENRLSTGAGTDLNGDGTGIESTGLKVDQFIGGQHITNLQFALNERIRQSTDAAKEISDVINGVSGATISASTAAIFAKGNGDINLQGNTNKEKAEDLQQRLASGDLRGVNTALDNITKNVDAIKSSISSVAGGIYGENNAVLKATLEKTNPATSTSTVENNFATGVNDLKALVAFRQSGGTGSVSVEGGTSIKDKSIAEQANGLVGDFKNGKITSSSQDQVIKDLTSAFSKQLKANGVEASPGVIQDMVKAVAQGQTLSTEQKDLYESKTNNIGTNFLALIALEKSKVAPPTSPEAINKASKTIVSNSGAVSQAATNNTKPEPSENSKLINETFAKYNGTPSWKLTMDRLKNESEGNYGENLPAAKNKFQTLMRGFSNILDQGIIKQQDGSDPKSVSDAFVSKMLEIADQLLRKSVAQYSYGFADSASISTSNYNKGSDTPLSDMYNMTKAVGAGIQNGIRQADKYTGRRDDEKQSEGEKLGLGEAMDKYKAAVKAKEEEDKKKVAQTNSITNSESSIPIQSN